MDIPSAIKRYTTFTYCIDMVKTPSVKGFNHKVVFIYGGVHSFIEIHNTEIYANLYVNRLVL